MPLVPGPRLCGLLAAPLLVAGCFADRSELQREDAEDRALGALDANAHVDGVLRVNDVPFPFAGCASGEAAGFRGVELQGAGGGRFRLVHEVDDTWTVLDLPPGGEPTVMKSCSRIAVDATPSLGEGTARGVARLDCAAGTLHVAGSVSFVCRGQPRTAAR